MQMCSLLWQCYGHVESAATGPDMFSCSLSSRHIFFFLFDGVVDIRISLLAASDGPTKESNNQPQPRTSNSRCSAHPSADFSPRGLSHWCPAPAYALPESPPNLSGAYYRRTAFSSLSCPHATSLKAILRLLKMRAISQRTSTTTWRRARWMVY